MQNAEAKEIPVGAEEENVLRVIQDNNARGEISLPSYSFHRPAYCRTRIHIAQKLPECLSYLFLH